jgi:hypothetical protein
MRAMILAVLIAAAIGLSGAPRVSAAVNGLALTEVSSQSEAQQRAMAQKKAMMQKKMMMQKKKAMMAQKKAMMRKMIAKKVAGRARGAVHRLRQRLRGQRPQSELHRSIVVIG